MRISKAIRKRLLERAKHRCEYCLGPEDLLGDDLQVDHIIPKSLGGTDNEENLCMSCSRCNRSKWIVFSSVRDHRFSQIYLLEVETCYVRRLTEDETVLHSPPSSPDGRYIVFCRGGTSW